MSYFLIYSCLISGIFSHSLALPSKPTFRSEVKRFLSGNVLLMTQNIKKTESEAKHCRIKNLFSLRMMTPTSWKKNNQILVQKWTLPTFLVRLVQHGPRKRLNQPGYSLFLNILLACLMSLAFLGIPQIRRQMGFGTYL